MANDIIVFDKVSYIYGEKTPGEKIALDNISINIERSGITGIIGHTGSGKSTLLRLMNGLLKPKTGKIYLDGKDIHDDKRNLRDVRFRVGLVFQYPEYQLFEETVYKDIAFGPKNMGLDEEEIDQRVKRAIEFVGLTEDYMEKSPFDLSGGEKRRVAIAGIIAMEPEVLVLDEPAAGLDPIGREEIFGGLERYRRAKPEASVIIVSHSMEDMARYCDRIIVMNESRVMMSGTPREVFGQGDRIISSGLGLPQITRIMNELSKKGMPVRTDIYTVKEAQEELMRILGGGKRC
ncbi:MAG: energy-coupling factor transporter ATPase [Ruminococcaceae bacterium]|nr:energy-coupling factor transporter ATPase [Oscillospiraceae bacterium]